MKTYKTKSGDTWDSIAKEFLGDEFLMDELTALQNQALLEYYILPEDETIIIPEKDAADIKYFRAPWSK